MLVMDYLIVKDYNMTVNILYILTSIAQFFMDQQIPQLLTLKFISSKIFQMLFLTINVPNHLPPFNTPSYYTIQNSNLKLNQFAFGVHSYIIFLKSNQLPASMAKSYAHGPIPNSQRKCTDGLCLLLFIFMSLVMVTVTVYAIMNKGIVNLMTPADSDGKLCGVDVKDFKYLYFVSPHANSIDRRVCVSVCPNAENVTLHCSPNSLVKSCSANSSEDPHQAVEIYPTTPLLNRVCVPQAKLIRDQIMQSLQISITQQQVTQVQQNWRLILIAIPGAILITILIMIVIRFTACFSIYFIITVIIAGLFFGTYYFYDWSVKVHPDAKILSKIPAHILYKVIAGVCLLLGTVILVTIFCFRKRINIAISMIKAAARFVNQHWYLFTFSIFKFVFTVAFTILCIIQTWGLLKFVQILLHTYNIHMQQNIFNALQTLLLTLHLFYFLWGIVFISESSTFMISGAVVDWYFKSEDICCPSISRYAGYHSGSVCHGSFYIALFGLAKILYEWFKPNAQKKDSIVGKIEECCNFCCCICATYIFTLINRGSYAFIHLSGRSYCQSTFKVLGLRTSQPVISSVMIFLELVFSFILRLEIIALTVGADYLAMKNIQPNPTLIQNPQLILYLVGLIAFFISEMFVSVYVEAADTLAVCFLIDKEYGEDDEKCPEELREYLQETRKNDGFID